MPLWGKKTSAYARCRILIFTRAHEGKNKVTCFLLSLVEFAQLIASTLYVVTSTSFITP